MPFKYLTNRSDNSSNAHKNRTVEAIWSNYVTNYDNVQGDLFVNDHPNGFAEGSVGKKNSIQCDAA